MTYRYAWTDEDRWAAAVDALCELASFALVTLRDDPHACIRTAAEEAVARMYERGGMAMVADYVEHFEAADRKLRANTERKAA